MSDHTRESHAGHASGDAKGATALATTHLATRGSFALGLCPALRYPTNRRVKCYVPDKPPKRPDPSIYSQQERFALGQSLAWDSPDIITNHTYGALWDEIEITVRNLSPDSPALGTLVRFEWSPWSIGMQAQELFSISTDLNRAGMAGDEAVLKYPMPQWLKDAHNNIAVRAVVIHPHDRNADNNIGEQSYLGLKGKAGTQAQVTVPVHNHLATPVTLSLYVQEADWSAALSATNVTLNPGQTSNVTFSATPPGDASGAKMFNVVALNGGELYGGVVIHLGL